MTTSQFKIFHRLLLAAVTLSLAFLLTNCACNNGEGYCGARTMMQHKPTNTSGDVYGPRTYYLNVAGFTCRDTAGNTLSSHKDAIEYDEGQFYSTGTVCDTQKVRLDPAEVYLAIDGKSLIYGDETYLLPK